MLLSVWQLWQLDCFECWGCESQPKCIYVNAWEFCQKASLFAPWCTSNQLNLTSFPTQPPSPRAPAPCSPQPVPSPPAAANIDRSRVPKPHCRRDPQTSTRRWVIAIRLQPKETDGVQRGGGWFASPRCLDPIKLYSKKNLFETTTYTVLILSYLWNTLFWTRKTCRRQVTRRCWAVGLQRGHCAHGTAPWWWELRPICA